MLEKDRVHDDRINALSDLTDFSREDTQNAYIHSANVYLVLTEEEMFEAIKIGEVTQENSTFVGVNRNHNEPYYIYHMGFITNLKGN